MAKLSAWFTIEAPGFSVTFCLPALTIQVLVSCAFCSGPMPSSPFSDWMMTSRSPGM